MIAASTGLLDVITQPLPPQTVPALVPKQPLSAIDDTTSQELSFPMAKSVAQVATARFRF